MGLENLTINTDQRSISHTSSLNLKKYIREQSSLNHNQGWDFIKRKQESKKERKHTFDQESDQEEKKTITKRQVLRSYFFSFVNSRLRSSFYLFLNAGNIWYSRGIKM